MSRPRMWMQVGTWPLPSGTCPKSGHVHGRPSRGVGVRRRRWIAASIVSAAVLGATAGCLGTAMLMGQVCG